MKHRGTTLVELLVACTVMSLIVAGLLQVFIGLNRANTNAIQAPPVDNDAVAAVNEMARWIRVASINTNASKVVNSAFHQAKAGDFTVYTDAAGNTTRFYISSGQLIRVVGTKSTTIIPSGATVTFTYCLAPSQQYYTSTDPNSLTWYTSVTNTDLPRLFAVKITVKVLRNSSESSYTSIVRARNAPNQYPS